MSEVTRTVQWLTVFLALLAIQGHLWRIERLLAGALRNAQVVEVRP